MTYENLLIYSDDIGLCVKEVQLRAHDGIIKGKRIAIRKDIPTLKEKGCVLAEELGHYYTTVGDILDTEDTSNMKQELKARKWGYDKKVGLVGLINAFEAHCTSLYEIAEYLDVTELYLRNVLYTYKSKYGLCTRVDNYIISFEPTLNILKLI